MKHRTHPCPGCGRPIRLAAETCRACWKQTSDLDAKFPLGGSSRAKYGVIVSFRNATGGRLTIHREGKPTVAVKAAIAAALVRDDTYLVTAVSNPETIYRDLQGSRASMDAHHQGNQFATPEQAKVPAHLLAPELRYRSVSR